MSDPITSGMIHTIRDRGRGELTGNGLEAFPSCNIGLDLIYILGDVHGRDVVPFRINFAPRAACLGEVKIRLPGKYLDPSVGVH